MSREKLLKKLTKLIEDYELRGEVIGLTLHFPGKKHLVWDGEKFV